jgi:hypothetical protein
MDSIPAKTLANQFESLTNLHFQIAREKADELPIACRRSGSADWDSVAFCMMQRAQTDGVHTKKGIRDSISTE